MGTFYTLKNDGLNTTQRRVKYGRTQRLGCLDPAVGLLPRRLGLYLTQHFLECIGVMVFLLYQLYFLSPYPNPKPTPQTKRYFRFSKHFILYDL